MKKIIIQIFHQKIFSPNDFTIVKVDGKTKNSFRHHVVKITGFIHKDTMDALFYKRLKNTYTFIETNEDVYVADDKDVVLKLSKPTDSNNPRFHKLSSFY